MTNLIPLINSILTPEMQGILYFLSLQAQKNSVNIYCAGGFVRDLLLGRENRQLHLIVGGSACNFARQLIRLLPGKLTVYEKIGTATLVLPGNFVFRMVTAQEEFNPYAVANKASPEVSMLKKTLFERDFTIDTPACSLGGDDFGRLYDFFGGSEDLANNTLRVLYRLSFVDRPLRVLRLVRLEQRFNFSLEGETESLLCQAIAHGVLGKVSKESLSGEIRQFFREPSPTKILLRLTDLALFRYIFPRINLHRELVGRLDNLEGFLHRMEKEKAIQSADIFITYLSLLFSGLSDHDFHYMCHFMRLKRKERQGIRRILENKEIFLDEEKLFALDSKFLGRKQ